MDKIYLALTIYDIFLLFVLIRGILQCCSLKANGERLIEELEVMIKDLESREQQ